MDDTFPTITEQLTETESALARFRRTLRRSDQQVMDGMFEKARRHAKAISLSDSLLPFESILLAIVLEQAKELAVLRQEADVLLHRSSE